MVGIMVGRSAGTPKALGLSLTAKGCWGWWPSLKQPSHKSRSTQMTQR